MESDNETSALYKQALLASLSDTRTGRPPATCGSIGECANGALAALRSLTSTDLLAGVDGTDLLTERAKLLELKTPGRISANGTCRLIKSNSCWIALNLARQEDWALMPAWLQTGLPCDSWQSLELLIQQQCGHNLVLRGRLMGLPVTEPHSHKASQWYAASVFRQPAGRRRSAPVVIDLSSLWAGPLCTHLLLHAGATVIKVESSQRPDATRFSTPEFHQLVNAGKFSVSLDLSNRDANRDDISSLNKLLLQADIVVESSRPRALRQMGIEAEAILSQTPGLTWISITGYGRSEPQANWVAFGDDAAIAAGAVLYKTCDKDGHKPDRTLEYGTARPNFVGDALSDPLTGIHAALAAWEGWLRRSSSLIDISLAGVTAFAMQYVGDISSLGFFPDGNSKRNSEENSHRQRGVSARPLGADTKKILAEFTRQ